MYAAVARGAPLPDTWLVDERGLPTTDGALYPHRASLAPMAGHKGFGIVTWHTRGYDQNDALVIDFKRTNLVRLRNA